MYCENCGEKINANAKFCVHCGTKLIDNSKKSPYGEDTSKQIDKKGTSFFKNKPYHLYGVVVIIILLSLGGLYWFKWRPSKIRTECAKEAFGTNYNLSVSDLLSQGKTESEIAVGLKAYSKCLEDKGIN